MKIAVYSLTRDRLEFTKHCFKTLWDNAGYPFDHFIIDNGSEDGTVQWLRKNKNRFKNIIFNEDNKGVHISYNQMRAVLKLTDYNIVIKMDNDCEVISKDILKKIVEIYQLPSPEGFTEKVLSPKVEGINRQPKRHLFKVVGDYRLGLTGYIGGLFLISPMSLFQKIKMNEANPIAKYNDSYFCEQIYKKKISAFIGYIESLTVKHYLTTDGQAKVYPKYFERKRREEKISYGENQKSQH